MNTIALCDELCQKPLVVLGACTTILRYKVADKNRLGYIFEHLAQYLLLASSSACYFLTVLSHRYVIDYRIDFVI